MLGPGPAADEREDDQGPELSPCSPTDLKALCVPLLSHLSKGHDSNAASWGGLESS